MKHLRVIVLLILMCAILLTVPGVACADDAVMPPAAGVEEGPGFVVLGISQPGAPGAVPQDSLNEAIQEKRVA